MIVNSETKLVCLLGHPVKQSFSPIMHNYLFEKYKQNNVYVCFDVEPKDLEKTVESIKSMGIEGCNVTIPHKVNIIKYLDYIDYKAKLVGAVNTIKNEGGVLKGYNTDGAGFVKSVIENGFDLKDKRVMILGCGGACRSISIELAFNNVKSIEIRNRSIDKAIEISNIIKSSFKLDVAYSTKDIDENDLSKIDVLINTTPIGMGNDLCPINESLIPNKKILVCDIVYKPHETSLIKWARKYNLDAMYGIDMLINQGLSAFCIWTGIRLDSNENNCIKEIYEKNL